MTEPYRKPMPNSVPEPDQRLDALYVDGLAIEHYIRVRAEEMPFIEDDGPASGPPPPSQPFFGVDHDSYSRTRRSNREVRAWKIVQRDLATRRLLGLGWRTTDANGFRLIESIDPRFWLDARLRVGFNAAKDYVTGLSFDDIHILEPSQSETVAAVPTLPEASSEQTLDLMKMSKKDIRQLAIDGCAHPNQVQWWQTGQDVRRAGYVQYLKIKHNFEPPKAHGYSKDSWEASEQEYKKVHGLLKPKSPNRW